MYVYSFVLLRLRARAPTSSIDLASLLKARIISTSLKMTLTSAAEITAVSCTKKEGTSLDPSVELRRTFGGDKRRHTGSSAQLQPTQLGFVQARRHPRAGSHNPRRLRGREGARGRGDSARAHERGVHEVVDEHVEALDVRVLRRHHLVHNVAALQLQLRQCLQAGRRAPFIRLRHARARKGLGGRAA